MPLPVDPTLTLVVDFILTAVLTVLVLAAGIQRAGGRAGAFLGGASAWMALTGGLAAAGLLAHFDPPRPLPLFLLGFAGAFAFVRSEFGARLATLPLTLIVGFQAFRIAVELCIHRAAMEGIAPIELSWSGWNYDVFTGATALLLAPFADRLPNAALHAWNAMGLGLLAVVVGTAVLSMPTPFQQIVTDPPNVWVTHFPFVWLPMVLVVSAIIGHGVLYRALRDG